MRAVDNLHILHILELVLAPFPASILALDILPWRQLVPVDNCLVDWDTDYYCMAFDWDLKGNHSLLKLYEYIYFHILTKVQRTKTKTKGNGEGEGGKDGGRVEDGEVVMGN